MPPENASAVLLGALSKLLTETAAAPLRLEVDGVDVARATQASVVDQLSDYVLPRLVQLDAPVVVVVGGSTGAGKSTLVNSLVGERVTESGVLRPTTRSPVLVHNPGDAEWFERDRLLPDLKRAVDHPNNVSALQVVPSSGVPKGLAILDAPDIDSIEAGNRRLATQLLAAADLWLFVTSAARYADQVPWDYLRLAAERSTSLAVVLDRTSPDAIVEVRGHLARMMTSRGLSDSPLFTVPESVKDHEGLLTRDVVMPVLSWLRDIAADPETRWTVMKRTLDGAIRHAVYRSHDIADALEVQMTAAGELYASTADVYDQALTRVSNAISDGSLLSGELLSAWRDFDESGDLAGLFERRRFRRRVADGFSHRNQRGDQLAHAAGAAVHALAVVQAEGAAEEVGRVWKVSDAGRILLAPTRGLDRPSHDLRTRFERVVADWLTQLSTAIQSEAADSRKLGAIAQHQLEGLTAVLAGVVLDDLSRLGVTARGRAALESVTSPDVVRRMVDASREQILAAITSVLEAEQQRFLDLLDSPETVQAAHDTLREAARQADYARHTDALDEKTS
ncbi:MAG TPA: dynamin family protein [Aeromicrobium sp.]|nr:dynamin family protein [Aeromicrobium sp.]